MRREEELFNRLRAGIKPTWNNLCSQLEEVLLPFFGRLLACRMINSFLAHPSLFLITGLFLGFVYLYRALGEQVEGKGINEGLHVWNLS